MNASCHPAAEPASASHPAPERGRVTSAVFDGGGSEEAGAACVRLGGPHVVAAAAAFNLSEFRAETGLQVG